MDYEQAIIDLCARNRISTTEVADALGKSGVLPTPKPLIDGQYAVGRIRCAFTAYGSNYELHSHLENAQPGEVLLIFTHECESRAVLGSLVTKFLGLYRQVAGIVVLGLARDRASLLREDAKLWCEGYTPLGCVNEPGPLFPPDEAQRLRDMYDGGVAVCDGGGVVAITADKVGPELLDRLHWIEAQEDLWFYCLDTLKWTTRDIVCHKRYLTESSEIPAALLDKVHPPSQR